MTKASDLLPVHLPSDFGPSEMMNEGAGNFANVENGRVGRDVEIGRHQH